MARILNVNAEPSIRKNITEFLVYEGYNVEEQSDIHTALKLINDTKFDAILFNENKSPINTKDFLQAIVYKNNNTPVVIIGQNNKNDASVNAINAIKFGAYDYLKTPLDINRLITTLKNATHKSIYEKQLHSNEIQEIIGVSPLILKIKERIEKVAPTNARVLITGENGTGKELVAKWIHEKSTRKNKPFIEVNCAAIPNELIESELFGHEKGAFTSAYKQRIGKLEQANGGTIFLDEIGDMSLSAQAKVLRVLQENKITRVGGNEDIKIDVRVLAATNKNLLEKIETHEFRSDLFHRLNVISIHVPSLNQRLEDIPKLTDYFLEMLCFEYGQPLKKIQPEAISILQKYKWTGNIRELRNMVERILILSGVEITSEDVKSALLM